MVDEKNDQNVAAHPCAIKCRKVVFPREKRDGKNKIICPLYDLFVLATLFKQILSFH
jgi:hypothetical protein